MKKTGKVMLVAILVGSLILVASALGSNNSLAQENSAPGPMGDFRIDDRFRSFRDSFGDGMNGQRIMPEDFRNARIFSTMLTGGNEVPAVNTQASGTATVGMLENRNDLMFFVSVKNIRDITQSHIHLGQPGENGPVVATLFPNGSQNENSFGQEAGVLATGTITGENLSGPLQGRTINDLIEEIERGNAYVNVHTRQNPNGEIRGQLEKADMNMMMDGMMNR